MVDNRICKDGLMYDPTIGIFLWLRPSRNRSVKIGQIAGCKDWQGYRKINFLGKKTFAHRLAWLLCEGGFPMDCIDHINGIKSDNRICNLRPATRSQNGANRVAIRGMKGAFFHKSSGKWSAQISKENKKMHLGLFDTEGEAHEAYKEASLRMHGEFSRF